MGYARHMTLGKARRRKNTHVRQFVAWAGTQRKAAELLGLDESMVSLLVAGKRNVTPAVALKAEQVSAGQFRKEVLVWGETA